jgi:hypothetical protein
MNIMTAALDFDTQQLVADLAWEFSEKKRNGEKPVMADYLRRCPDSVTRTSFKRLVNMDLLLRAVVQDSR